MAPDTGRKVASDAERLDDLTRLQQEILEAAVDLVRPGGHLAYATCSVLSAENDAVVTAFLARRSDLKLVMRDVQTPAAVGDGFFMAVLRRT